MMKTVGGDRVLPAPRSTWCKCANWPEFHSVSVVLKKPSLGSSTRWAAPARRLYVTRRPPQSMAARALDGPEVPDYFPATWKESREKKPLGPSHDSTAEEATLRQLDALQDNDVPYLDHGIEVMYRFAGFDPFRPSTYFGPHFDLGQFERFRRIFHHTTYRVLLNHKERKILSSLYMNEHCFKQRVWVCGVRPGEEGIFEFSLEQRVGGSWDGYWLTNSLRPDQEAFSGGIAY